MGLPPSQEVPVSVTGTAPYRWGPGSCFASAAGLFSFLGDPLTRSPRPPGEFDDLDYPAYTIGLAADLLGVQPAFLRSLDAAGLLTPNRSAGGQRRYSRAELTLATRVRELLDQNMPLTAATRIVRLEHQLAAAHQHIAHLENTASEPTTDPSNH